VMKAIDTQPGSAMQLARQSARVVAPGPAILWAPEKPISPQCNTRVAADWATLVFVEESIDVLVLVVSVNVIRQEQALLRRDEPYVVTSENTPRLTLPGGGAGVVVVLAY
jgi:hypothetical protein